MKNPLKMFAKENTSQAVAIAPKKPGLVRIFADKYEVDHEKLLNTLKMTAFKPKKNGDPEVTNEQMMALLVVANQYNLNPFTRELYAFPSAGTIVPIVSVDGWMRITNSHPKFDGMEFEDNFVDGKLFSITCKIYRKDRKYPTIVTEYLSECKKDTGPWNKWPARMLRHKAAIQCARYAFGFSGIYDPDEADRIAESTSGDYPREPEAPAAKSNALPSYPDEKFNAAFPIWKKAIDAGKKDAAAVVSTVQTKYTLSPTQIKQIQDCEAIEGEVMDPDTCPECAAILNADGNCGNCRAQQESTT